MSNNLTAISDMSTSNERLIQGTKKACDQKKEQKITKCKGNSSDHVSSSKPPELDKKSVGDKTIKTEPTEDNPTPEAEPMRGSSNIASTSNTKTIIEKKAIKIEPNEDMPTAKPTGKPSTSKQAKPKDTDAAKKTIKTEKKEGKKAVKPKSEPSNPAQPKQEPDLSALMGKLTLKTEDEKPKPESGLSQFFKNKKWNTFDLAGTYKILAFTVDKRNKTLYVGILATKQHDDSNSKKVYNLKPPYNDRFIYYFNKPELLTKEGYLIITRSKPKLSIVHLESEAPFAEFTTNGPQRLEDFKYYTLPFQNYKMIIGIKNEDLSNLFLWDNWTDLDLHGEYTVYAFTVDRVTFEGVGVLAKKNNTEPARVYFVKGIPKLEFKNRHNYWDSFPKKDYQMMTCNDLKIAYLTSEDRVATFKTDGTNTFKGSSFPKVVDLQFFHDYYPPSTGHQNGRPN